MHLRPPPICSLDRQSSDPSHADIAGGADCGGRRNPVNAYPGMAWRARLSEIVETLLRGRGLVLNHLYNLIFRLETAGCSS